MINDICTALLRANLLAGVAILVVMLVRNPARRLFGPEVAYGMWVAPALVAAGALLPAGNVALHAPDHARVIGNVEAPAPALLLALWMVGMAGAAALLWRAQARFQRLAKAGRAGPAVVGFIAPRIVMPTDDGRYTPEERDLIRAHEREHIARRDPQARAWMAVCQCLAWFNPLVHLAAHLARLDQELACDAAVLRRRSHSRGPYARALLKTQLASTPLPFGCYWPARGRHPLEVRVALLKTKSRPLELVGACLVGAAAVTAGAAAWATQPPSAPPPPTVAEEAWAQAREAHVTVLLIRMPPRTAHHS
ncbi:MAG TPA: M56 family metallopeptidase [Phenylobacterium sp.]|jgi:beta-lactamase regulating signal transducer with metallopeptidase domain